FNKSVSGGANSTEADRSRSRREFLRVVLTSGLALGNPRFAMAADWPCRWQLQAFHFHADFDLPQHAPVVQELIELQRTVPATLQLPTSDESIHIYLFRSKRVYRNYLRQYFPGVPDRPAMYIKQRGYGMVFAHTGPEFAVDVRHEATHAVLHCELPFVPLWLDEGLAEYFEMPAAARFNGHPHLADIRRELGRRRLPDLDRLEAITDLASMTSSDYRDAWAWVHFLLHGPAEAHDVLLEYVRDIHQQTVPGPLAVRIRRKRPRYLGDFVRHFAEIEPLVELPQ
ncbi:MAG: DUF1570 domain-containing protein, partial [Planctomycetales bacterium]|nr:DUF1570 domain-containing protein [Planctomycetales bacterium]